MLILALDASQIRGVVVLCDERGTVFAQNAGSTSVVHSEGLLTLLHETLENNNYSLKDVDLFACGVGPGSFTGIRVALATVKALAQALGKPMQGVSSLKALAPCSPGDNRRPLMPVYGNV
ncbi:MAG TPA: tRNA (adenosine(37)-N6)-threonylcarbamoyltransferase complex dimerization subunit type 1 TsaB, partial [Oligoflexia bacterium]|nr:tRNA (adenosine(37)-N6)-threonylcarbamoyltransferase complex dimerization subunit type 1 TsaB [Oligoflexia bacterium]